MDLGKRESQMAILTEDGELVPILAFTLTDPGVHVALILAFTFE